MRHVNSKSKETARVIDYDARTPFGLMGVGSNEFDEYLESVTSFYVESLWDKECGFSVRKEYRAGTAHWYGYKRFSGKLKKVYIGQEITFDKLLNAAKRLPTAWYVEPKFRY
jgi:hypothetical protein